ncbi:hypothetical protein [Mucilaginibacter sp.]|jgi:hypothetical protein|uniref:hypothetical protein n=1 Tax=Mucilaginibacter sp. TaxID=1882438 RepID=UPI003567CAC6
MGVKYRCEYKAFDNSEWKIELSLNSYVDTIIDLYSVSEQPAIPNYDSEESDDVYSPFVKSSVDMSFYNRNGEINISELQLAKDKDFIVNIYKDGPLYWTGYIVSGGLERPLSGSVETVNLTAIDGLTLLDEIPYVHQDLPVDVLNTIHVRCPMNYMRQILFSNLGISLPIRWSNNLRCTAFNDDMFAGQLAWGVDDLGLYSYQSDDSGTKLTPKSCGYILRGFVKSAGCRIYQAGGRWNIRRVNLIPSKSFGFKQIPGSLGPLVITSGTDTIGKMIGSNNTGAYPFIKEDAKVLVEPGLKSVKVEYEANVPENALPNGSQDKVTAAPARPYYWGFPDDTLGLGLSQASIDGRTGYATEIFNPGAIPVSADKYFVINPVSQTEFGLPLDGKILVPKIQFGFVFSIMSGFPFNVDGTINFATRPLKIQVILNTYFGVYYLNENGFWVPDNTYIGIVPDTPVRPNDSVRIDFNRFQGILMPEPADELDTTKEYSLKVRFVASNDQFYIVDNIYVNIEQNNDIYEAGITETTNTKTEEVSLDISSSYGGYMASNFMTSWVESGREFMFSEGAFTTGSLTSILARAIMRCKAQAQNKIDLTINVRNLNWTFDEFYTVVTFGTSVFVPVKASYNTDTCEVKMTIIECRNHNVELYTKHYGSNDKLLSN